MTTATVKKPLTPNRRRDVVENDAYAAFTRRVLAAYARRVADGDIEALTHLYTLATEVDDHIRYTIADLRQRHGYSWTDIATRLGCTKQAAQQRWGGDQP